MSLGKQPVVDSAGVKVKIAEGKVWSKAKGKLEFGFHRNMTVKHDECRPFQ